MEPESLIPPLRPEIELLPGPPEDNGSPTGILHDPLNGTFDKFGWIEREILIRLRRPVGLEALRRSLERETTAGMGKDELAAFLSSLQRRGLLQGSRTGVDAGGSAFLRLATQFLFFRLPLLRPDSFLKRTLWLPRLFGSRFMKRVYFAVLVLAVLLFIPRSGTLVPDAGRFLTPFLLWKGALWLAIALAVVKTLHEFSHAYAAALRGIAVRSMGLFFMVFTPIPYCDVTGIWRLPRRERLAVSFAGVRTELVLAAFSLLGWSLLRPGVPRDICMTLCTASVASTLLTNLNPGMRFDGYYLFADFLGVDNLQRTAFAEARAFFRRVFLGMAECRGGPELGPRKRALLVVYAVYVCFYRLIVYFGIALLVYHFFPKVLGILLFLVEAALFIVRPVAREAWETAAMIRKRGATPRLMAFAALAAIPLLWLILPLPRTLRLEAVVSAPGIVTLYAPGPGRIVSPAPGRGDLIPAGASLLEMTSSRLENEIAEKSLEYDGARLRLEAVRAVAEGKDRLPAALADAERAASLLASLRAERAQLHVTAEAALLALEVDDLYHAGNNVAKRAYLGRFLPVDSKFFIVAYLSGEFLDDLKTGDKALFSSNAEPGRKTPVTITGVRRQSSRDIEEPALIGPMGGALAVRRSAEGTLAPASPVYRVEASVDGEAPDSLRLGQTGGLYAQGGTRSLAWDFAKRIGRTLLEESGF